MFSKLFKKKSTEGRYWEIFAHDAAKLDAKNEAAFKDAHDNEGVQYSFTQKIPDGILKEAEYKFDLPLEDNIIIRNKYKIEKHLNHVQIDLEDNSILSIDLQKKRMTFHNYATSGNFSGKQLIKLARNNLLNLAKSTIAGNNIANEEDLAKTMSNSKEYKALEDIYVKYNMAERMVSPLDSIENNDAVAFLKYKPTLIQENSGKTKSSTGLPSSGAVSNLQDFFSIIKHFTSSQFESYIPGGLTNPDDFAEELNKISSIAIAQNDLACISRHALEKHRSASEKQTKTKEQAETTVMAR